MNKKTICVISTVHPDHDNRILKQCKSLSLNFNVDLIIQSNKESIKGIKIRQLPIIKTRISRALLFIKACKMSFSKKYNFYLIHDPELLVLSLILKISRRKVVYDIHEDYKEQILDKRWINKYLRRIISLLFDKFEKFAVLRSYSVICATPFLEKKFIKFNQNTFGVYNYPPLLEFKKSFKTNIKRSSDVFRILYVGNISHERGIFKILDAIKGIDCEFLLAGNFVDKGTEAKCESHSSWKKVNYFGYISRKQYSELLDIADLGLLIFLPNGNHINAQPNKLFEYMSGGVFQLASNFPHWTKILEHNSIGLTVDPNRSDLIQAMILSVKKNKNFYNSKRPEIIKEFMKSYTWESQIPKLMKAFIDH